MAVRFNNSHVKKDSVVACVDLGSSTIRALIARKEEDKIVEIYATEECDSHGVKRGVIINRSMVTSDLTLLLERLQKKANINLKRVYVTTGGIPFHYKKHSVKRGVAGNNPVDPELIEEMQDECNSVFDSQEFEIIQVYPQEYRVNNEAQEDIVGAVGNLIEADYLVVACKKSAINNLHETFDGLKLEIEDVLPAPIASAEGLISDVEKEEGVIVVDMGASTTSIAFYFENQVRHMSVIPFGGQALTNDIKTAWQLHVEQAEKLKTKFGVSCPKFATKDLEISVTKKSKKWAQKQVSHETLAFVIESRLEEIFANVASQIDASGYFEALDTGILLCGGSSRLKEIKFVVSKNTGLQADIGRANPGQSIELEDRLLSIECSRLLGMLKLATNDCEQKSKSGSFWGAIRDVDFESKAAQRPATPKQRKKKQASKSVFPGLFDKIMTPPDDVELEK